MKRNRRKKKRHDEEAQLGKTTSTKQSLRSCKHWVAEVVKDDAGPSNQLFAFEVRLAALLPWRL